MAEDGGVYVAGLEYLLNPGLFPHYTNFVREHLRFSIFSPLLASFIRITHLSIRAALLLADLVTIWGTLAAALAVLRRCTASNAAQLTGVSLLAAWWTMPVAGTSLLLMDPYVTARSFSIPLSLLAIALALQPWRRSTPAQSHTHPGIAAAICIFAITLSALFHPLMAGYGAALVLLIRLARTRRPWLAWLLAAIGAVLLAAILHAKAAPESPALLLASISRYYWFLSQWHWFELLGLAGPFLVLIPILRWRNNGLTAEAALLIRSSLVLGCIGTLVALLFARESTATHLVARLQPLRVFLFLYAVMALLGGASLWRLGSVLRHRMRSSSARVALRLLASFVVVTSAAAMFFVQSSSFSASPHIEWPWRTSANHNPWVQAFLWTRANTPNSALFALDARYVNRDGEDAQTFRAIALRSALPDYSKDGGEASITPYLAIPWERAAAAQVHLSQQPDGVRDARLLPLGATWMILDANAATAHPCPYENAVVKVCRLAP